MKRLLAQPKPADLLALYVFLLHTVNRQQNQSVFATVPFIARGLGWSVAKVKRVKKRLRDLSLIEAVTRRDASGRVSGHYVRVRFVTRGAAEPEVPNHHQWPSEPQPEVRFHHHWCFEPQIPIKETKNTLRGEGASLAHPPTLDDLKSFAATIELPGSEAEKCFDHYEANGWMIGKNRVKNWQAVVRKWKRGWQSNKFDSSAVQVSNPLPKANKKLFLNRWPVDRSPKRDEFETEQSFITHAEEFERWKARQS